jgi:hypothetical protein
MKSIHCSDCGKFISPTIKPVNYRGHPEQFCYTCLFKLVTAMYELQHIFTRPLFIMFLCPKSKPDDRIRKQILEDYASIFQAVRVFEIIVWIGKLRSFLKASPPRSSFHMMTQRIEMNVHQLDEIATIRLQKGACFIEVRINTAETKPEMKIMDFEGTVDGIYALITDFCTAVQENGLRLIQHSASSP